MPESSGIDGRKEAPIKILKQDYKGKSHVLISTRNANLNYLVKENNKWSDPLVLGDKIYWSYPSLALDQNGFLFASYVNRERKLIGRWIKPRNETLQ
jgi:hypothetical protein